MASEKQRKAARSNVKKAQAGAKRKQTLKNMPKQTKTALGKEANKVRKGEAKTRKELNEEASRLQIKGRSKMGQRRAAAGDRAGSLTSGSSAQRRRRHFIHSDRIVCPIVVGVARRYTPSE